MLALVTRQYRRELARCTEQPGCPAELHLSTCAEIRDLLHGKDEE